MQVPTCIFICSAITAHTNIKLCAEEKFSRLSAVYCIKVSQKLLEKHNLQFYMVQILHSNAKILNL